MAALLFVIHKKTDLISAPTSCVHLIIILFFVYFKILGIQDPLMPLENLFQKIFLGGVMDQLQETFYGKQEVENPETYTGKDKLSAERRALKTLAPAHRGRARAQISTCVSVLPFFVNKPFPVSEAG